MNQYFLSLRSWGHMLTFKSFHLMKTSPFYEKKKIVSGTNTFIYRSLVKTYIFVWPHVYYCSSVCNFPNPHPTLSKVWYTGTRGLFLLELVPVA